MKTTHKLIQLDAEDNVLVVRQKILKGERMPVSGEEIEFQQAVPLGFKVASKSIRTGEKIIKYGMSIGSAIAEILPGEIVHVHNVKSDYVPTFLIENQDEYEG